MDLKLFEGFMSSSLSSSLITLNCAAEVLALVPLDQRSHCEVQFLAFKVLKRQQKDLIPGGKTI